MRGIENGLAVGRDADLANFQPSASAAVFHLETVGMPISSMNVCTMQAMDGWDVGTLLINDGGK
jgi:hypothetical protein